MSTKQTSEATEAELIAGDSEIVAQESQSILNNLDEMEKQVRTVEDAQGIPELARSKPLPERMAAVGMEQPLIDRVSEILASFKGAP
jgi:hypothetical protein